MPTPILYCKNILLKITLVLLTLKLSLIGTTATPENSHILPNSPFLGNQTQAMPHHQRLGVEFFLPQAALSLITAHKPFTDSHSLQAEQFMHYYALIVFAYQISNAIPIITPHFTPQKPHWFLDQLAVAYQLFLKRYNNDECLSETPIAIHRETEKHYDAFAEAIYEGHQEKIIAAATDALRYALITLTNDAQFTQQLVDQFILDYKAFIMPLNTQELLLFSAAKHTEDLLQIAYAHYGDKLPQQTNNNVNETLSLLLKNPRAQKRIAQTYITLFKTALGLTGNTIDTLTYLLYNDTPRTNAFQYYSDQLPFVLEAYTLTRLLSYSTLHALLQKENALAEAVDKANQQLNTKPIRAETLLKAELTLALADTYPGNSLLPYLPRTALFEKDSEIRLTSALCQLTSKYLNHFEGLESTALTLGQAGTMLKNINLTYGWILALYGYINKWHETEKQLELISKSKAIADADHQAPEMRAIARQIQEHIQNQKPEDLLTLQGIKTIKCLLTTTAFTLNLYAQQLPTIIQPAITSFKTFLSVFLLSLATDIYIEHLSQDYANTESQLTQKTDIAYWVNVLQGATDYQALSESHRTPYETEYQKIEPAHLMIPYGEAIPFESIKKGYLAYEAVQHLLELDPHFAMRTLITLLEKESESAIAFLQDMGISPKIIGLLMQPPPAHDPKIEDLKIQLLKQILGLK